MQQYNIHTAKTHLSALVEKAAGGDAFIIAKAGKPMVKLFPIHPKAQTKSGLDFLKAK